MTVEATLKDLGFENIELIAIEDVNSENSWKMDDVSSITIDGKSSFRKGEKFYTYSKVKISYHTRAKSKNPNIYDDLTSVPDGYAAMPSSAYDFRRKDYNVVINDLKDAGFTNISIVEIKDLKTGILVKNGSVESISVDGSKDFEKGDVFPKDSKIRIDYHTFKD